MKFVINKEKIKTYNGITRKKLIERTGELKLDASNDSRCKALLIFLSDHKKMTKTSDVSALDLQALVDNELDPESRRIVMKEIMKSPALMKRLDDLLEQKRMLQSYYSFDKDNLEH